MKKFVSIFLLASGLLITTASAETGSVHSVTQQSDGKVMVCISTGAANPKCAVLIGSVDAIKNMTAMALTGKAGGRNLLVKYNNGGWNYMQLQ